MIGLRGEHIQEFYTVKVTLRNYFLLSYPASCSGIFFIVLIIIFAFTVVYKINT
jgi:hypothetical protein